MNNIRIDYIDVEYNSTILYTGIVYHNDNPVYRFERLNERTIIKKIMELMDIRLIWNYLDIKNEENSNEEISKNNDSDKKLPARIS